MKITKVLVIVLSLSTISILLHSCVSDLKAENGNVIELPTLDNEAAPLNWLDVHDLETVKLTDKKIIVDIYTDWCGWCKVMDKKTFSDPDLSQYLAENYHMVKFNAEEKKSIQFQNKIYDFVQNGKRSYNSLSTELLEGRLSFPSFVVLDENLNTVKIIRGFKEAEAFKSALLEAI